MIIVTQVIVHNMKNNLTVLSPGHRKAAWYLW